MKLKMTMEIWEKPDWFIAKCPELDIVAQGLTIEEAKDNLNEVIQLQFEEMLEMGTLEEFLEECGYKVENDMAIPSSEMVGYEKRALQVG